MKVLSLQHKTLLFVLTSLKISHILHLNKEWGEQKELYLLILYSYSNIPAVSLNCLTSTHYMWTFLFRTIIFYKSCNWSITSIFVSPFLLFVRILKYFVDFFIIIIMLEKLNYSSSLNHQGWHALTRHFPKEISLKYTRSKLQDIYLLLIKMLLAFSLKVLE